MKNTAIKFSQAATWGGIFLLLAGIINPSQCQAFEASNNIENQARMQNKSGAKATQHK